MMNRRDALKTIGGLSAAAMLPSCGGGSGEITTYVYMMMENRSYDHFFGSRSMVEGKSGDGLAMGMSNMNTAGEAVPIWTPNRDQLCDLDPPHGWDAARLQWNGGMNSGFVTEHEKDHGAGAIEPMQYITRTDVPVSYALADKYATADRWFCSVMGPTWPNRFYWHTGQSGGLTSNLLPSEGINWPSIYHRLDAAGVDWRYYFGSIPVVSTFQGLDAATHVQRFSQFLADAADGVLPPVVYIDPAFSMNDDHPPIHPINGQELIATVYKALAASPQWKNCLLVVTYDENGGFFDHVSPPTTVDERAAQGFGQMGFRVPTLVAGPYVKEGFVSSVVYDHCSALRHLEKTFDLEPLNERTRTANDLGDFIDAKRLASGDWKAPIELPEVNVADYPMPAVCSSMEVAREEHPVIEWANANPDKIAGYDARPEIPQYRRAIREFLASPPRAVVK